MIGIVALGQGAASGQSKIQVEATTPQKPKNTACWWMYEKSRVLALEADETYRKEKEEHNGSDTINREAELSRTFATLYLACR